MEGGRGLAAAAARHAGACAGGERHVGPRNQGDFGESGVGVRGMHISPGRRLGIHDGSFLFARLGDDTAQRHSEHRSFTVIGTGWYYPFSHTVGDGETVGGWSTGWEEIDTGGWRVESTSCSWS